MRVSVRHIPPFFGKFSGNSKRKSALIYPSIFKTELLLFDNILFEQNIISQNYKVKVVLRS